MGIFDGMMGNASEVNLSSVANEYSKVLAEGEKIERAYRLIRDMFIFTNKRLILVDKQGVTGKKQEYHSIPYKNIQHFSIETAGHLDLDAELKIWLSGGTLIEKQFNKSLDIYEVQSVLAKYVLF
ncbi:MAG: PH domain-containing protein [Tissierellaceae bacterium]|nr:PH domain-containing protein [Tissierellaceae bacterium]